MTKSFLNLRKIKGKNKYKNKERSKEK